MKVRRLFVMGFRCGIELVTLEMERTWLNTWQLISSEYNMCAAFSEADFQRQSTDVGAIWIYKVVMEGSN